MATKETFPASGLRKHATGQAEAEQVEEARLYDDQQPMADEPGMITAAEEVLTWLVIEKCHAPDDRAYTPREAQKIIQAALEEGAQARAKAAELEKQLRTLTDPENLAKAAEKLGMVDKELKGRAPEDVEFLQDMSQDMSEPVLLPAFQLDMIATLRGDKLEIVGHNDQEDPVVRTRPATPFELEVADVLEALCRPPFRKFGFPGDLLAVKDAIRGLMPLLESLSDRGDEPRGTSPSHMLALMQEALSRDDLPADKVNRWLGFVQGVLIARGQLDLDEERDRTRKIFRAAYTAAGIVPPDPVSVSGRAR